MKKTILLLLIISFSSCSLTKKTIESDRKYSPQKVIRNANKNINKIKYIQAKAKISFTDNKKIQSNTITLRISSNQKLWANATLGAARVLINNDSIKYYNKIERNFFVSDFNYINKIIGIEIDFQILQSLILGVLFEKYDYSSFNEINDEIYSFKKDIVLGKKSFKSMVYISPYNFRILKIIFDDDINKFEVDYDDYLILENQNIPTKITFRNNGVENFHIEIKSIVSLDKINLPFRIPKSYKRINF
ncbi:MAG: hypothetical protein CMC51_03115 [Flavobacteriaceae bacterium]|nr:hypothetical protein [Flavobacteriaceae bacterium]|tara:strand:+ start:34367 stop:35107 length:741 start_codon:yes stop_codon:yes gene_type:complete